MKKILLLIFSLTTPTSYGLENLLISGVDKRFFVIAFFPEIIAELTSGEGDHLNALGDIYSLTADDRASLKQAMNVGQGIQSANDLIQLLEQSPQ